jgi:hypothetical protein
MHIDWAAGNDGLALPTGRALCDQAGVEAISASAITDYDAGAACRASVGHIRAGSELRLDLAARAMLDQNLKPDQFPRVNVP